MKFFKKISLFVFVFLFCAFMPALVKADGNQVVEEPVVISADMESPHMRWGRPIVVGLVEKGADVLVYIDGNFAGVAKINESNTETNNFYYQPVEPLAVGNHTVYTVAKDRKSGVLSASSETKIVSVTALAVPTVYKPNEDTKTGNNKPLISGLTKSGTRVLIYIDGVYNGKTEIITHQSGTAGFVYKPFLHLNVGRHTYFAIAETKNGNKSAQSRVVSFNIEKKYPAPTLVKFDVSKKLLTGLAKNDSKIKIFLDKKLTGEFKVVNHKSGTANFAYTLQQPLTNGAHMLYAVSVDERGKESVWSNIKTFSIAPLVKEPVITKEAASESAVENTISSDETVSGGIENKTDKIDAINKTDKPKDVVNKDSALNEILGKTNENNNATQTSGLVDEKKDNQSKLKMNLVVFVLFLVALMGWIFWVNRELIKEKTSKEKISENITNESKSEKK